jgi:hypothetical protein
MRNYGYLLNKSMLLRSDDILCEVKGTEEIEYSESEVKEIRSRLKELGYLD